LREARDPTLVRHIYDLHMIRDEHDVKAAAKLIHEVMLADAATRGDSFPVWKKAPLGETLRAIEGIPKDKVSVDGYANFQRDMVYGDKPDFTTAMGTLNTLADHLKKVPSNMTAFPFTRPTVIDAVALVGGPRRVRATAAILDSVAQPCLKSNACHRAPAERRS
jgi:hypothetical protein